MSEDRIGVELPWIFDGISAYRNPDGTWTNRWREELDRAPRRDHLWVRRMAETDLWIAEQKEKTA